MRPEFEQAFCPPVSVCLFGVLVRCPLVALEEEQIVQRYASRRRIKEVIPGVVVGVGGDRLLWIYCAFRVQRAENIRNHGSTR